jgi:hypothetical protein
LRKQSPTGDLSLVVHTLRSREERVYTHADIGRLPPMWTQNGGAVLVRIRAGLPTASICRVDLATGEFREVLPVQTPEVMRSGIAAISPDTRTIYFGARDGSDGTRRWDRVVAVDVATRKERVVLHLPGDPRTLPAGGELGLAVSPDGLTLALFLVEPGAVIGRILLVGTDGTNARERLPVFPAHGSFGKIAWTADDTIWFSETAQDGAGRTGWRILRMPATGGSPEPATFFINGNAGPGSFDVSPDGSRLAWYPVPGVPQSASDLAGPQSEVWSLDLRPALNDTRMSLRRDTAPPRPLRRP